MSEFTAYFEQLERLSTEDLDRSVVDLVLAEKQNVAFVIAHIAEISRRKGDLERAYPNLFVYSRCPCGREDPSQRGGPAGAPPERGERGETPPGLCRHDEASRRGVPRGAQGEAGLSAIDPQASLPPGEGGRHHGDDPERRRGAGFPGRDCRPGLTRRSSRRR